MQRWKSTLSMVALTVALAGGWFFATQQTGPATDSWPSQAEANGSGILDGLTFSGDIGPLDKAADVKDNWIFENGMFVSTECERRCNYPARPYFVRHLGEAVEFVSETRCPETDARIIWRGRVADKTIKGVFTWTVTRWYWTIEKQFWFEGTLSEGANPVAGRT